MKILWGSILDWLLYDNLNDEDYVKDDYVNIYNDLHKDYIHNNNLFKEVSKWPNDYLEEFLTAMGKVYDAVVHKEHFTKMFTKKKKSENLKRKINMLFELNMKKGGVR